MGHCLYLKKGNVHTVPVGSLKLGNIVEGTLVKIPENGAMTEFYVAKHNYESGLNGNGRTLMVRKYNYESRLWDKNTNAYANSEIDTWLNTDYKNLLNSNIYTLIGSTKFPYTIGNSDATVSVLERSIFLLSLTELGITGVGGQNVEGTILPIDNDLKVAYINELASGTQWTRSPVHDNSIYAFWVDNRAKRAGGFVTTVNGIRPCFTLPATTSFDAKTLEIKI